MATGDGHIALPPSEAILLVFRSYIGLQKQDFFAVQTPFLYKSYNSINGQGIEAGRVEPRNMAVKQKDEPRSRF